MSVTVWIVWEYRVKSQERSATKCGMLLIPDQKGKLRKDV
jgi:hypothetical protein